MHAKKNRWLDPIHDVEEASASLGRTGSNLAPLIAAAAPLLLLLV